MQRFSSDRAQTAATRRSAASASSSSGAPQTSRRPIGPSRAGQVRADAEGVVGVVAVDARGDRGVRRGSGRSGARHGHRSRPGPRRGRTEPRARVAARRDIRSMISASRPGLTTLHPLRFRADTRRPPASLTGDIDRAATEVKRVGQTGRPSSSSRRRLSSSLSGGGAAASAWGRRAQRRVIKGIAASPAAPRAPGTIQAIRSKPDFGRRGEHLGAELVDQPVDDPLLVPAGVDALGDVDLHVLRDGGVRDVERRVAGGAADLAGHLADRQPEGERRAAPAGRSWRSPRRARITGSPPGSGRSRWSAARRWCSWPAILRAMPPSVSITKVSGSAGTW